MQSAIFAQIFTDGMKLIIDIGNTTRKYYFFEGKELTGEVHSEEHPSVGFIEALQREHGPFSSAVLSTVVSLGVDFVKGLQQMMPLLIFDQKTRLPLTNLYSTPATLGPDRLAAAVAGHAMFPGSPVLVIDAGTCIKYDLVKDDAYHGGIIAPGIRMQAKALHTFTDRLPLVNPDPGMECPLTGASTTGSILSGIINATVASMEGIIARYMDENPGLMIILSGGDLNYFDKRLKYSIFALPNLVAAGLNEILDFNEST
ncbi:MAG: type III pantothenate kinase [Bacteroidales bacterium]